MDLVLATTCEDASSFVPLGVVVLLAFFVPVLLSRFSRIPIVVGEILAGVMVGPSLLGWVSEGPTLTFMADIGLAFLMFLAGMEIDFKLLFPGRNPLQVEKGPAIIPIAFWLYLITLGLAMPGAWLLRQFGLNGGFWLLTFVLSATSLGVLLPIVKERELMRTFFGRVLFVAAMLADFITVLLLTIRLIVFEAGLDPRIFSVGLLFVAFLVFFRLGPGIVRIPAVQKFFDEFSKATIQIKVRGAIALLMLFVVMAESLDAELILGAFLGGMIISLLKGPEDEGLVHKLEAFGFGFFIPVFFILVGVGLNLRVLLSSGEGLLSLPIFFLVSLAVKVPPLILLRKYFSWRQILGGGLLLNTHLSLEVAVAVIGQRVGLFDETASTLVIIFSLMTVVLMPLLFNLILPYTPHKMEPITLFAGVNDLGLMVAEQLRAHGDQVRFIEEVPGHIQQAVKKKFPVLENSVEGILEAIPLSEVKALLVLGEDDTHNLTLSRQARAIGISNVIALVKEPSLLPKFIASGIRPFTPAVQRATMIAMMARNPDVLSLLTSTTDERDSIEVVLANPNLAGKSLRDLELPGDMLVLAIHRNDELLIPRGNTRLEMHDRVSLMGNIQDLQEFKSQLEMG